MLRSLNSALTKILSGKGYILDSPDFGDIGGDDETTDYANSVDFGEEEMLKHLNLEGDDRSHDEEEFQVTFVGMSFDSIRPKMQSIFGDGQVLKLIQKKGTGEIIPEGAQVTLDYVGYFEYADQPFDSTLFRREKCEILRLGKGQMIPGLEIGVRTMKKHEKALFLIKPELAYGKLGCPPRILPNAEVLFRVELKDFLDNGQADAYESLAEENKKKFPVVKKIVEHLMVTANDEVRKQKIKQAIGRYKAAGEYLANVDLQDDDEASEREVLLARTLENLIVCYNRLSRPKLTCEAFDILPIKTSKSYYHHGRALYQLCEYDKAIESLQKSFSLTRNQSDKQRINEEIQKVEFDRQRYLSTSKRFAQMSLGLVGGNTSDKLFEKATENLCDFFLENDSLMKQELPKGLTAQEEECLQRVAAIRCLSITRQSDSFGDEVLYLTKNSCLPRKFK